MAHRRFLYGFGIGILMTNIYKANRKMIRAAFIKTVQGTLALADCSKEKINEVKNTNNNISKRRVSAGEIQILYKQLGEIKKQINNFEKL